MVLELLNLKPYPRLFVLSSLSPEQALDICCLHKGASGISPQPYSLVLSHLAVQLSDDE